MKLSNVVCIQVDQVELEQERSATNTVEVDDGDSMFEWIDRRGYLVSLEDNDGQLSMSDW